MPIRIILIILFIGLHSSCRHEPDNFAKDKNFYFTITSPSKNTTNLVRFLKENMNNKRVTITYRSGEVWPFYYILDEDEKLPYDSLMPPHYYIHAMKELDGDEILPGEYFVDIQVMPVPDTIPNYELTVFLMDSLGLKATGHIATHYLEASQAADSTLIYDTILKSLIRYSFK